MSFIVHKRRKRYKKFNDILPKTNKIFKIETKKALKNFNSLIKKGKNFLIDREICKKISV